jgi:hypothetical protein
METKFIYDLILPCFTGDDDLHPELKKVHRDRDGYLYATDRYIALRVPYEKVMNNYKRIPGHPLARHNVIQDAIDREDNIKATIRTGDLVHILSHAQWKRIMKSNECKEYSSLGGVVCRYCRNEYEYGKYNGNGAGNIRIREFMLLQCESDYYYIRIGTPAYRAAWLHTVAVTAQILQAEEIEYLYSDEHSAGVFSFAGVDILLAPGVTNNANEKMVFQIP